MVPRQGGRLSRLADPESLPGWISDADIDFLRERIYGSWLSRRTELVSQHRSQRGTVSALRRQPYHGPRDLVVGYRRMDQVIASVATFVPQLRGTLMLPGCGQWTQQERAREVNNAMIGFLQGL
jgi:hypothetical protein